MILVFDTSALSRFLGEDQSMLTVVAQQEFDRYVIPLAADAELRFGFAHGSRRAKNIEKYEAVVRQLAFEIACPDQDTSLIYADLANWAKQHGVALSNNDLWIAATCNQLGGKLLTLDGDLRHLPQVNQVNF